MSSHSCADCAHCSIQKFPKPVENADDMTVDSLFVAEDEDQSIYVCRAPEGPHANRTIGPEPVICDAWREKNQMDKEAKDKRMNDLVAAWEARQKARETALK